MKINETSLEHFLLFACRLIKRQSKSGPQLGSRIAWNKGEMETNIQRMPRVHQNQEQHQNRQDTNCRHRDPQISRFPSLLRSPILTLRFPKIEEWGSGRQNLLGGFFIDMFMRFVCPREREVRQMYKYLHEIFTIRRAWQRGNRNIAAS